MRINNYVKDTNVTANDKWIGSDFNDSSRTKNFTPTSLAQYYNHNQVIDTPYLKFTYQTLLPGEVRAEGTVSFENEIGSSVAFSSISTFLVSNKSLKGNLISDYLNFLNGGKVILSRGENVNDFGFYKILTINPYITNTNFFVVTLSFISGHGSMVEDKDYILSLLIDSNTLDNIPKNTSDLINDGQDGIHPFITLQDIPAFTLQNITDNGNITTNDIILNSLPGEYGDYTVTNIIQDLGVFQSFSSPTSEDYTSYFAGYGFGLDSSLNTYSASIYGYESSFYVHSQDTTDDTYNGTIGFEGTDFNGSPYLSLTNRLGKEGLLKVTNLINNEVILQFPNKPTGEYTIATTDDISSSQTLAQTLAFGNQTGGNNILVNNSDSIVLENGSLLRKGSFSFGDGNIVLSGISNSGDGYIAGIMGWGNPSGTQWSDLNGTYVKTSVAVTPSAYGIGDIGMHTPEPGTFNYYLENPISLGTPDPAWNGIAYFLAPGNKCGWGDPNNNSSIDVTVNFWRLCVLSDYPYVYFTNPSTDPYNFPSSGWVPVDGALPMNEGGNGYTYISTYGGGFNIGLISNGNGGISRICSVGYEDMWQSGIRYAFDLSGYVREATNCFNYVPNGSFDNTQRFKVGSIWTLDNGDSYECTDATTGAAVWILKTLPAPTLQSVTDSGNTTTNSVTLGSTTMVQTVGTTIATFKDNTNTTVGTINEFGKLNFTGDTHTFGVSGGAEIIAGTYRTQNYGDGFKDSGNNVNFIASLNTGSLQGWKSKGSIEYSSDYSANYGDRTLVDKAYVQSIIPTVGSWGALNYPTWSSGTPFVKMTAAGTFALDTNTYITSPLTTKGDIFVRNGSADTRLPIGLDTQVLIADSTQATGIKWGSNTAATPTGYYGAWQDDFTQTAAASNTGYAMKFHTADITPNGISIVNNGSGNPTRITFANTGIYNLQFSAQFQNTDNAQHDVTIWLRLNGVDVAGSSGLISVPARKSAGAGNEGHLISGWNYVLSVLGGQYYELVWSTSNAANVTMQYYAAGSPPPSAASVIMTVTQQSGIMSNVGVTRKNANNSTNSNINYCGVALGTSVSESLTVWTITRITTASNGSITTAIATGVAWTNRESATYI